MIRRSIGLAALLSFFVVAGVSAVQPDEVLADPDQEARARALSVDIRCLVCQNQSIDDSDAELARDMRVLIRDQIKDGRSDDEIRDFLVERYGAFVLLKPPVQGSTLLLWFGPLIVLLLGAAGLALYFRGRARTAAPDGELSDEERSRIDALIDDGDESRRQ